MTAEIAIMNKNAVALAADSAVTIGYGEKLKIYNTNKLFVLSKYHPVGVMIYGNAELLGVSWETAIKSYRETLGSNPFDTVEEYGENFIDFLEKNRTLFPESEQDGWVHRRIFQGLVIIREKIDDGVEAVIHKNRQINEQELKGIIKEAIEEADVMVAAKDDLPLASKNLSDEINQKYGEFIRKIINQVFQKLPITIALKKKLKRLCQNLLFKDVSLGNQAGLVIAGFGEKEFFPSLVSFEIDGIFCDKLKYKTTNNQKMNWQERALVFPFAQSEMVHTFMQGIDPNLQIVLDSYLSKLFDEYYPEQISQAFPASKNSKQVIKKKLKNVGNVLVKDLMAAIEKHKRERNVDPVLDAVEFLPKEELAGMAEALVNLTSFKRRVTLDAETVGGPIDVAVISKGDGFIWVKRKHYFEIDMNPQFRANYYR